MGAWSSTTRGERTKGTLSGGTDHRAGWSGRLGTNMGEYEKIMRPDTIYGMYGPPDNPDVGAVVTGRRVYAGET